MCCTNYGQCLVMFLGIWVFVVFGCSVSLGSTECPAGRDNADTHESRLRSDILCGYRAEFRPVKDHTKAVNIKVRFSLKYASFDPPEETLTVHSWVALVWQDEFLPWTPSDYGGLTEIILESYEIWTPKLSLFNADVTANSEYFHTTCLVESNGKVMCVPHLSHSAVCRTNLERWPYDTQNCSLYFGSWMHTGEQINFTFFTTNPIVSEEFQNGPGWKLQETTYKRLPGNFSCCPNSTYPMLQYTFALERVAAGPAAIIVVPCIVLVLLTLASMLLNVNDYIRLFVSGFSLYGHFLVVIQIGYEIPKHSSETPIILLFLRDSMVMALMSTFLTLFLMSLQKRVLPAPSWMISLNRLISSGPVKYVVFTEFDLAVDTKILTTDDGASAADSEKTSRDWNQFSNLLNSLFCIIYCLIYLVIIAKYIPYGD